MKANAFRKTMMIASMVTLLGGGLLPGFAPNKRVYAAVEPAPSVMVEDFEDGISDVKMNSKRIYSATLNLESNQKYVRNGQHSARIDYDMIGILDNPSQIEVGYTSGRVQQTRYPTKVGMWVYGNNDGHLLTTKFRDNAGDSFQAEFYDENQIGVNWTGWKYIVADVPQGLPEPIKLELFFQLKESKMSKKNKGSIWVDDISFIYSDVDEDKDVPNITPIAPIENAELTAPLNELKVELTDDGGSGLDLNTLSVHLDGTDITGETDYSPSTKLLTYPGAKVDGGYHELAIEVKDGAGNPAGKTFAFTMDAGERLSMSAESEAVSNDIYPVQVSIRNYLNADSAKFALHYDPNTLLVDTITAATGAAITPVIDNDNGIVMVTLGNVTAAAARDGVTVNFKVSSNATLERGEDYKTITMSDAILTAGGVQTSSPLAAPIRYTIAFPYQLVMTGAGFGTASTFTVLDHKGSPYEGADIVFTGLLKQSSVVTVSSVTASVYEDDDLASVLKTVYAGERYYASAESDDGLFEVILEDGQTTGYISETDVSSQPLSVSHGKTNANGQLTTDLATLALGTYQVQAFNGDQNSKILHYEVVEQYGTDKPQYVQSYVTEDMSSQLSIAWQTKPSRAVTYVQYIEASDWGTGNSPDVGLVKELQAESELQVLSMKENGTKGEIRFHNALIEGLQANTAYKYRVGYEANWSEWYEYSTVDQNKSTPTSFVFVTDSHTNESHGVQTYQELMTDALTQYPLTQFVMHGGDMVDVGGCRFACYLRLRKFALRVLHLVGVMAPSR